MKGLSLFLRQSLFIIQFTADTHAIQRLCHALDKTDIDEKIIEGEKGIAGKIDDLFKGKE